MAYKNKEDEREKKRLYYLNNKATINARNKKWRDSNKEATKQYMQKYSAINEAKIKDTRTAYYQKTKTQKAAYCKEYRTKNKDKIATYHKKYAILNREKIVAKARRYEQNNREKISARAKARYEKNKRSILSKIVKRNKDRYHTDPTFNLVTRCRKRMREVLRCASIKKTKASMETVGCTGLELKKYIEGKFLDGMNWGNMGEWHIDHIIPVSKFDFKTEKAIQKCFHYTNLRPLWAHDNLKKSNKLTLHA